MNLVIAQPVKFALRTLTQMERNQVLAWFDHLKNWDDDATARKASKKLDYPGNVFVLQTSPTLRMFFSLEGDAIEVLDLATKDTIVRSGQLAE